MAKPASKAYRREMRARLVRLNFSEQQVVEHLASALVVECGTRSRAAWRLACELSLDEAAARYNAELGDAAAPMRGSRIWEYEQWPGRGVRPPLKALKILARVYSCRWVQLVDLADLDHMPERDRTAYHQEVVDRPDHGHGDASGLRELVTQGSRRTFDTALRFTTTNVDRTALDQLNIDLGDIARSYLYVPPQRLYGSGLRLHDRLTSLLEGRQRPHQTRELSAMVGKCGAMLAWMAEDLGHHGSAMEHSDAAWAYAQHADDATARRWVRIVQSRLSYWAGDYLESARLASDGMTYGGHDHAEIFLTLLEARALAVVGQRREVARALHRWERLSDQFPAFEAPSGNFSLTLDRQKYLAGTALLSVGEAERASTELGEALDCFRLLEPRYRFFGTEMLGRIDMARSRLRVGELDGAVETIVPVLGLPQEERIRMIELAVGQFQSELAQPLFNHNSLAADCRDRIFEFRRETAGARLGQDILYARSN